MKKIMLTMLAVFALAACSASTPAASTAAAGTATPSPSASPAYDDANACTAYQDAITTGVPQAIEASYAAQNNQPLATWDFVTDAAYNADPHLQALVGKWSRDDQGQNGTEAAYSVLMSDERAIAAWCAKQGDPVTG